MAKLLTATVGLALLMSSLASAQHGMNVQVDYFSSSWSHGSSSEAATPGTAAPVVTPTPTIACTMAYKTRTIPHVAVSGTSVTMPIQVATGCAAADTYSVQLVDPSVPTDLYWGYSYSKRVSYSWQHRHLVTDSRNVNVGSVMIGGATTMANVAVTPYCGANDTMFTVNLISSSGHVVTVGQLYCVLPFPTACSAAKPSKLNAWVSTTNYLVLANTLLASWQNWVPAASYIAGGVLVEANFMQYTNFSAFQTRANELADGTSTNVAASCNAFGSTASFAFPVSTGVIVIGGNYYGASCATSGATNAFNVVKAWLLVTDVIVADPSVSSSILTNSETQTVTLGYPTWDTTCIRKTLERYCLSRFERTMTVCGAASDLVSMPSAGTFVSANMLEERTIRWNGICGVTQCCIGDRCSNEVAADGRSCVLPRIPFYGTQAGVTLKRGTESFYIHIYLQYEYSYTFYAQARSYDSYYGEPALRDDSTGVEVKLTRYSTENRCFQLNCIPNAASLTVGGITPYSNTVCPVESDWQMPYWMRYYSYYYSYYYIYVWTYYSWTKYGWSSQNYGSSNNEYRALFTRPSSATACGCSAIGMSSWVTCSSTFPVNTRYFNATIKTNAASAVNWVAKDFMLVDSLLPVSPSASEADRKSYCTCWAQRDATDVVVAQRLAVATSCFKCPATITDNQVLPRGFWRMWGWGGSWWNQYYGDVGTSDQLCFRASGSGASSLAWDARPQWQSRCCYTRQASSSTTWEYIPGYPSKLETSQGWGRWPDYYTERLFYYANDVNPEEVCCRHSAGGMGSTAATCRLFRDRRPTEFATSTPFTLPRGCAETWTPQPPWGWGRGDPYCSTMDGAGFECNFWGEALWTSCGSWKVHVAAEPVSVGAVATIITAAAVSEGNETIVIQRNNVTGDAEARLNGGDTLREDYSGAYLTVAFELNSKNMTIVRVISTAGTHEVSVESMNASLTLSAAPSAKCIGTCSGLMGNCDGDASNDIKSRDGTVSLPSTASSSAIFHNVVVSFLINNTAQSLFDYVVSVPPNTTTFVPKFVTASTLANCPAACKSDPGCCLDNEVAGPAFAAETVATVSVIAAVKNQSVPLTGYNWPPTVSANPNVRVLNGLPISQTITATDTDGLLSVTIDACTASDVTCSQDTTVNAATTVKWTLSTTATRNFTVTITAVDTKGARTVSYITIKSLPPAAAPVNAQSFTFIIPGTGFNAGHVYEARNALARDLAAIVNKYWNLSRRQTVAPAYTAASDFQIASVADVSTGVQITIYIAGDTVADAKARLAALTAQTTLTLTEINSVLSQLVSTAVTTTTTSSNMASGSGTGTTTTTSGSTSTGSTTGTTGTAGAAELSTLVSVLVTLASVVALFM